jgi:ParB family transcriptional regulator, chromosome partitioning protein
MAPPKGSRSFSTVAHTSVTADHAVGARPVPTDQVSPNPLNTRVISAESPRVLRLRDSIATHGQLEAVTVVTRSAFIAIFDEYKQAVEPVTFVQVTGGQRLMACVLLGLPITVSVNDELATDRAKFIAATAEENLGRDDLDALEQAEIVARLVAECDGNQSEAARRLERSQPWVAHRMAVLKLSTPPWKRSSGRVKRLLPRRRETRATTRSCRSSDRCECRPRSRLYAS